VDVLVGKLMKAARRLGVQCITASGGVSCNRGFREQLGCEASRGGFQLRLAEPILCTDNAAMVGVLAGIRLRHGLTTALDEEIRPTWHLEGSG
jgi:N6-L-threonylcarbamoyladenine synthase